MSGTAAPMPREALVAAAGETIRHGSKSFHAASRLFDRQARERAWLLYSWCRHCDDVCDGQTLGRPGGGGPGGCIDALEEDTRRVLAGERLGNLPFDGLAQVMAECPIPHRFVFDHLEGFALDEAGWRPRNEGDLIKYCYHVAGAVGCMMAVAMGVPSEEEETLRRASDLGIAFQLSNIARDVREDQEAGRCYLPTEWLADADLDGADLMRAERREALVRLVARLVALAERYEQSALAGVKRLPFRSRWAILAAAGIYGGIGRKVAALGPGAWDQRVVIRRREKLLTIAGALRGALAA
ncbi:MAG TPA: phytoene/squalene synthase family protein [Allosphingosinicella sp.]|nr:phytoene/squalene synthase family protein [Allosphingosinicella sp.]